MKADSGRQGLLVKNLDVRQEFEKIMKDPDLLRYWRNYIRGRLKGSVISKFERNTTPDDILSRIGMKIYSRGMEWDKGVYKTFRHFMYGKIQNIIRNKETSINEKYACYLQGEDIDGKFNVKPKNYPKIIDTNNDGIQKVFEMIEMDRAKFRTDVEKILKDPEDTNLLAIFTGLMEEKQRKEIKEEYGMSSDDYDKAWKKLKYRLKEFIFKEYGEMYK
jgi:hypothetical protein